jgi:hypothetical protein
MRHLAHPELFLPGGHKMLNMKRKIFAAYDLSWHTPEQVAQILKETPGRPLCQGFLVEFDGVQLVMLNDSSDPTAEVFWQEYAIVLPNALIQVTPGVEEIRVCGEQIESFTTNNMAPATLAKSLRALKNPANHCRLESLPEYGQIDVTIQKRDGHACRHCI